MAKNTNAIMTPQIASLCIVASSQAASAPVFTRSPGSVVATSGSDLELDYSVSGWPEPRLDWSRDTGSLRNNETCRIGQTLSP